ncbi:MAG: dTMP kinase [Pirellulales bacterium]
MFVSFDGVDGTGKSTQVELFVAWLRRQGREVVQCRDPGATPLGDELRKILLHRGDLNLQRRSEMLLYMAARAQLVEEVIRPALAAGKTVVSDRYLLANIVYQGYAGGLDIDSIRQVGRVATDGLSPDLTLVLDMPASAAAARIGRELDRMESQGLDFLEAVRRGFLDEAPRLGPRVRIVDAQGTRDEVHARVLEAWRSAAG